MRSSFAVSLLVIGAIQGIAAMGSVDFRPYFFGLAPALAAAIVCSGGALALWLLQKRFGFCVIAEDAGLPNVAAAALAALPFMVSVTLADILIVFPPNIHVELPGALAFYPVMGLIAQLALHIVPFAVALSALSRLLRSSPLRRRVWTAIVSSAVVEAAFQIGGSAADDGLTMLSVFVAMQLFAFGLVELYLFRRFDFVTMYVFRLTYYGYWHIIWGNMLQSSS